MKVQIRFAVTKVYVGYIVVEAETLDSARQCFPDCYGDKLDEAKLGLDFTRYKLEELKEI